MALTQTSIITLTRTVRATLVTGKDSQRNEFFYFKTADGWYDGYNEREVSNEYIRHFVFPCVVYVRFSLNGGVAHTMNRAGWTEAGCPLELTSEQVEGLIDSAPHPVDEAYRVDKEVSELIAESE